MVLMNENARSFVSIAVRDGVAVIEVGRTAVDAQPEAVRAQVLASVRAALSDKNVREIAVAGAAGSFTPDEVRALQHSFSVVREAARPSDLAPGARPRQIARIAVVGGGTMGGGIALAAVAGGYRVTVIETDAARADAARERLTGDIERRRRERRLSDEEANARLALLSVRAEDDALADADLVIEAVFEDLAVKRALFERLGQVCKPTAVLASNTSTLDIDVLAQASGRPGDVVGMHFFSPANVMKLLEVVRWALTSPDVLATAIAVAQRLQKHAVVCGVCDGFIGNRMLEPYLREADALVLEGATPLQIDTALETFGMAMGPFRMLDLAGVDVATKVLIERHKQGRLPEDPRYRIVCRTLYEKGRFGQKTKAGFYRYEGRQYSADEEVAATVTALRETLGVVARDVIADEEIIRRCLYPLINEGYKILDERIARSADDIDVVWLSGYGFPYERGGPMWLGEQIGMSNVADFLRACANGRGDAQGYWTLADSLASSRHGEAAKECQP